MKPKELLCIALIAENGKRYDAEVYTDGTFKNQEGEYEKLTPLQFENLKVLQRRADREKMLIVAANDVVPYREGDKEPEPYTENIAPLTEEDFLLPEERQLPVDMVTADKDLPKLPQIPTKKKEEQPPVSDEDKTKETKEPEKTDKNKGIDEKGGSEKVTEPEQESKPESKENTEKAASKPKKKKRFPIVLVIILVLLLLCGAGFGIGYMNGYFDLNMLPGVVMEELEEVTGNGDSHASQPAETPAPTPVQEQEPTPTPTPLPPKTEINLTINAMDGAEVSGSTDVGVNEDDQAATEQNSSETTSSAPADTN